MRYRFGDFEADAGRFVLRRGGAQIRIEPRPLRLLLHLLERHPEAVSRDELTRLLWPDAVVLEGSLTRAVRTARRALAERADDEGVIRTVRGRGYAIDVPVERIAEPEATDPARAHAAADPVAGARPGQPAPRRLAALLSADMAGFARHRARDPEGTAARLAALAAVASEIVARHRGLLVHFVDDNLLAVFPAAVEATRAALTLRDQVARLDADHPEDERFAFRIGLHLADVIEDGGRVYGGGVQIAARLERLAEPGGVCLSAAVRDQIAGRIDVGLDDLGEQRLKGVADPVRVYRLSRPAAAIDRS